MGLSLSLANAPAMRCELVNGLLLGFIKNGVLSAPELLIVKVLRQLLACRVCTLSVWRYLSMKTDTHHHVGIPQDSPFWLRPFATFIRYILYHPIPKSADTEWEL